MRDNTPVSEAGHVPVARLARGGARRQPHRGVVVFLAGLLSGQFFGLLVLLFTHQPPKGHRSAWTPQANERDGHPTNLVAAQSISTLQPGETADWYAEREAAAATQATTVAVLETSEAEPPPLPSQMTEQAVPTPVEKSPQVTVVSRTYTLITEHAPHTVPTRVASASEASSRTYSVYCLKRNPVKADTGTYMPDYPSSKGGLFHRGLRLSSAPEKETPLVSLDWVLYQPAAGTASFLYRTPGEREPVRLSKTVTYTSGPASVEFPELGALPPALLEAFNETGCLRLGLYVGTLSAHDEEPFFSCKRLDVAQGAVTLDNYRQAFEAYCEKAETSSDPQVNAYCQKRKTQTKTLANARKSTYGEPTSPAATETRPANEISQTRSSMSDYDSAMRALREFLDELNKKRVSAKSFNVDRILAQAVTDERDAKTDDDREKQRLFVTELTSLIDQYVASQRDRLESSRSIHAKTDLAKYEARDFNYRELDRLISERRTDIMRNRFELSKSRDKEGAGASQSASPLMQPQETQGWFGASTAATLTEADPAEGEMRRARLTLGPGIPITVILTIDKPQGSEGKQ